MSSNADSRKGKNLVAAVCDAIGIPTPDELIPMPSEVAADFGIPSPAETVRGLRSSIDSKVGSLRRF